MSNGSNQSWGITVLRIVVGIVFLAHGAQKVFTFGHHGVTGMSVVLMAVEFLGGAALVLGLLTRWAAALNGFDMVVAILAVHLKNGFFNPMGFEYPLTLLAACIALTVIGPGAGSVDGALAKRE
jgi:putative oxidoreductase